MALTEDQLAQLLAPAQARHVSAYCIPLNAAMREYGISTGRNRAEMFLAQILHESDGLRYWTEQWGPTPAQLSYEGRTDLGNIQPGDGRRYLGRGPIQITGRANYAKAGQALGVDLVTHPELLSAPLLGFRAAGWFWSSHGLNELADGAEFETITRRINGGLNGMQSRLQWLARVKRVLG